MDSKKDPIEWLRKYGTGDSCLQKDLCGIADEIEAQYLKLPVDVDGVPIRIGDEMEWTNSLNGEKERFVCAGYTTEYSTWTPDNITLMATNDECAEFYCDQCRHVKHDTVEGLLEELALQHEWGYLVMACNKDEMDEVIADYAERIRKAVQDE